MDFGLLFPVLLVAVMYLFFFLPQIKKQKKLKQFIADLKKGDKVVTTGGIHGGVKLKINRAAISMEASMLESTNSEEE
jgi:preprotein translocase subunit YajC